MTLTPVVRTLAAVVAGLLPVTLLVAQPAPVAVAASGAARAAATSIDDRALIRSGKGWVKVSSRSAFKKTLLKGTRAGATARTKGAATVGGKVTFQAGPGRGQATIKVGGKKRKTVSTAKKRLSPLTVSFSGSGTVVITVTKPRKGVVVDRVVLTKKPGGGSSPYARGRVVPISSTPAGALGNGSGVSASAVSPNGKYVAFWSDATNLVAGASNGADHLYLKDLASGSLRILDAAADGTLSNDTTHTSNSRVVVWKPDSTEVLFTTGATNLGVPPPGPYGPYLYAKSVVDNSVGGIGSEVTSAAWSPDGGTIAFSTYNGTGYCALVTSSGQACSGGLDNVQYTQFVFAVDIGTPSSDEEWYAVSSDASGAQYSSNGSGSSYEPVFSPDSKRVMFTSESPSLVPGDTNSSDDVFVKTLASNAVVRASTSASGGQLNDDSGQATYSPDGGSIAFTTAATTVIPGDDNAARDVVVKRLSSGAITPVSTTDRGRVAPGSGGSRGPAWSPDGRRILFVSDAVTLAGGGVDRNFVDDVYVKALAGGHVQLVSATPTGVVGNGSSTVYGFTGNRAGWAPDGASVYFLSVASNFAASDGNGVADVYRKYLG